MKSFSLVLLLSAALLVSSVPATSAESKKDGHTGMVYGEDNAFFVDAPEGWVLDNTSGVNQGLYAAFYPEGESWKEATAVMYVNTSQREKSETIFELIEYDTSRFRKDNPDIHVEKAPSITTSKLLQSEKKAEVRYYTGDQWGNSEAVAYIEEETIFVIIVLTSRTKEAFESAKPAFRELVESYLFLTTDVRMKPDEVLLNQSEKSAPAAEQ